MALRAARRRMHSNGRGPTHSARFAAAAAGEPLGPRQRGAPLHDESSSPAQQGNAPPPSVSTKSLYKVLFIQDEKNASMYRCRLCGELISSGSNSTGNLGRHLQSTHEDAYRSAHEPVGESGTKRAQLEDLARNEEAKRSRQGTMTKWVKRLSKSPTATTTEAFWILWLTKRGIAYDAVRDDLFQLARQVRCVCV